MLPNVLTRFLKNESLGMGQGLKPREVKSNITDNESATMKTSHGVIQGYNGVTAVDKKASGDCRHRDLWCRPGATDIDTYAGQHSGLL